MLRPATIICFALLISPSFGVVNTNPQNEAQRRDAPLDSYGAPPQDFGGLPAPVYGTPALATYPAPPPDIPPPLPSSPHQEYGVPILKYGPPKINLEYGPPLANHFKHGGHSSKPSYFGSGSKPSFLDQIKSHFGLSKPVYGPPSPSYGPPSSSYGPPPSHGHGHHGPPPPVYGPPKHYEHHGHIEHHGGSHGHGHGHGNGHGHGPPKQVYGPPPPSNSYGPPKPVYGPPKPVYGPPKPVYGPPKIFGPPKPVYGPPPPSGSGSGSFGLSTSYGPPPPSGSGSGSFGLSTSYGPPPPPSHHGVPSSSYGPPPSGSGSSHSHSHHHGNGPHFPTNGVKCDGWKPILGPIGHGGHQEGSHNIPDTSYGPPQLPQVDIGHSSGGHSSGAGGYSSGGSHGGSSNFGGSFSSGSSSSFGGGDSYSAGFGASGSGGFGASGGGGFGASGGDGGGDHHSHHAEVFQDLNLLQPGGFADVDIVKSHGIELTNNIADSYGPPGGDSYSQQPSGGLIPPSGVYGVPPGGSYNDLSIQHGSISGQSHTQYQQNQLPPQSPIHFRPPVPQGLIESIGNTVQHLDTFGTKPQENSNVYLPPPANEIPAPPHDLNSLPYNGAPQSFQSQSFQSQSSYNLPQAQPLIQEPRLNGQQQHNGCGHGPALQNTYLPPGGSFPNHGGSSGGGGGEISSYDASISNSYSQVGNQQIEHSLSSSYGPPASGIPSDSQAYASQIKTTSVSADSAQRSSSLKAVEEESSDEDDTDNESVAQSEQKETTSTDDLPGLSNLPGSLNVVSAQRSQSVTIPVQGALGSYSLQFQSSDPLGGGEGNNLDSPPHEQLLSEGLLQSILSAIEQPQQNQAPQVAPHDEHVDHKDVDDFFQSPEGQVALAEPKSTN